MKNLKTLCLFCSCLLLSLSTQAFVVAPAGPATNSSSSISTQQTKQLSTAQTKRKAKRGKIKWFKQLFHKTTKHKKGKTTPQSSSKFFSIASVVLGFSAAILLLLEFTLGSGVITNLILFSIILSFIGMFFGARGQNREGIKRWAKIGKITCITILISSVILLYFIALSSLL